MATIFKMKQPVTKEQRKVISPALIKELVQSTLFSHTPFVIDSQNRMSTKVLLSLVKSLGGVSRITELQSPITLNILLVDGLNLTGNSKLSELMSSIRNIYKDKLILRFWLLLGNDKENLKCKDISTGEVHDVPSKYSEVYDVIIINSFGLCPFVGQSKDLGFVANPESDLESSIKYDLSMFNATLTRLLKDGGLVLFYSTLFLDNVKGKTEPDYRDICSHVEATLASDTGLQIPQGNAMYTLYPKYDNLLASCSSANAVFYPETSMVRVEVFDLKLKTVVESGDLEIVTEVGDTAFSCYYQRDITYIPSLLSRNTSTSVLTPIQGWTALQPACLTKNQKFLESVKQVHYPLSADSDIPILTVLLKSNPMDSSTEGEEEQIMTGEEVIVSSLQSILVDGNDYLEVDNDPQPYNSDDSLGLSD